jgi:hypothetical protein
VNVPFAKSKIAGELRRIWNQGKPIRSKVKNIYGSNGAGGRIAEALAMTHIDSTQRRKLIAY